MDIELDKILCKKYPKLFKQRHGDVRKTALCWGFQCRTGWAMLIDQLCFKIQDHCDKMKFQVEVNTVKEKFAGLRFYVDGADEMVYRYIEHAERLSYHICEECGTMENVHTWTIGWYRTLCVNCAKKGEYPAYYTPLYYWYFTKIRSRWINFKWRVKSLFRRRDK